MLNTMRRGAWPVHLLAGLLLAIFVAALYFPLLFTNRVLAAGDILLYFYPYREAAASALREGHIPFWNPYLFGGAPLLANPQAAVLYPLHWPLIWLSPTKQVYWSAALHTWLLGLGGYALLRRWGANAWAGLAAGLILSGGGLIGGLIGHLNQLNVAAWAPWAVICVEGAGLTTEAQRSHRGNRASNRGAWPQVVVRIVVLAAAAALMLLAGHTQTAYIVLFGLGVWTLWPLAEWAGRTLHQSHMRERVDRKRMDRQSHDRQGVDRERMDHQSHDHQSHDHQGVDRKRVDRQSHDHQSHDRQGVDRERMDRQGVDGSLTLPALTETGARLAVYAGGVLLGALLSAPQLLPTLELSALGIRTSGLSFQEATSFSLQPLALLWTLLPTYGLLSIESIFATPAYTEYVAYIGVLGLGLAVLGAWRGRGRPRAFGLLFVLLGLLLGLGRWNPLYFVLHLLVPGFDLFRVPARWMLLYTLGTAVLAGLGTQWLNQWLVARLAAQGGARRVRTEQVDNGVRAAQEKVEAQRDNSPAHPLTRSPAHPLLPALLLLLAADLLLAGRALPYAHPTAPEAVDGVRSAPAHLLTDPAREAAAGSAAEAAAGRFLGLSTITYDPGDMADYRRIMLDSDPPQLDQRAFADLVIAQKVQELLVPNLPLLWRIPSLDGFDGGVLPLGRYNQLAQLLITPAGAVPQTLAPDGRLREQVKAVPPAALLNLANVQYLITDKVADLWFENVYYDRQIGATLSAAQPQTSIPIDAAAAGFAATHLDLIAAAETDTADVWTELAQTAAAVAVAEVRGSDGMSFTLPITAGGAAGAALADGRLDSPLAQTSGAVVAWRDTEGGRQEYRVRLPFDAPLAPAAISLRLLDPRLRVRVQAGTLYDERTGMFVALLPSDRGHFERVHSGDVKIYANRDLLPRAYLVTETLAADGPDAAAALLGKQLAAASAQPSAPLTVVEGLPPLGDKDRRGVRSGAAEIVRYGAEEVVVRTASDRPALLVLSDAFYPGWRAAVDGEAAPIYPTNVLFRGVPVAAGEHTVVFTYEPSGWRLGWGLAALGAGLLVLLGVLSVWGFRREGRSAV